MKGWKTLAWNGANALILAMDAAKIGYEIPEHLETWWLGAYVVGNIVLRLVTTGPVGRKE